MAPKGTALMSLASPPDGMCSTEQAATTGLSKMSVFFSSPAPLSPPFPLSLSL